MKDDLYKDCYMIAETIKWKNSRRITQCAVENIGTEKPAALTLEKAEEYIEVQRDRYDEERIEPGQMRPTIWSIEKYDETAPVEPMTFRPD